MTIPDDPEDRWAPYSKLAGFEHLYLEDSFVLAILYDAAEVRFEMEFVLTEQHPDFQPPRSGEQYCYRRGTIRFPKGAEVVEVLRRDVSSQDATSEPDMGNIDSFEWCGGRYRLVGDWRRLDIRCGKPVVCVLWARESPHAAHARILLGPGGGRAYDQGSADLRRFPA
ncbi:hypothetical protein GVY41_04280 [Frigidibacter albus]|uniref:Uncharacterized protein n=1 Tax=Frigidibacter albus TaxID=1465486 RepID=A0A6L8VCX7_9RHOB|nr:hypothetical protein [Frigidibacter albus]MZQ88103.1 hypothetical protein [Frigidibacter albus]NBE30223.1 hypothetical protein [Frigidibacter albus]GGH47464.1 hypothetical protein GCM10011341_08620 [Frigidibacter albus]